MRRIFAIAGLAALLLSGAASVRADAASYIRTLFDATAPAGGTPALACSDVAPLARFAAGRHWQGLAVDIREAVKADFCTLARESLARLHGRYPDLALRIVETRPTGSGGAWVRTEVTAGGTDWPVHWHIAETGGRPYLADIKVLGVSLAIMLRGLAPDGPLSSANTLIAPWRAALNRALPPVVPQPRP